VLGEDQLAVEDDVELAGFARFERGVEAGLFLDGGRETRSPGLVVSDVTVLDDDSMAHGGTMAKRRARGKGRAEKVARGAGLQGIRASALTDSVCSIWV
jgi:hypothetical protein